jgi:hypothetical protein
MFSVKLLLGIAAICSAILAAAFIIFDSRIIFNIGEDFWKIYTILFMLLSIVTTKEAVSINVEEDE